MSNNTLVKNYNYLDLRFHSYMFDIFYEYSGENAREDFFRHIVIEEKHVLEDYGDADIYEALRRQYEEFVGVWDEGCERAFNNVILLLNK